jgi:hypothetical protein
VCFPFFRCCSGDSNDGTGPYSCLMRRLQRLSFPLINFQARSTGVPNTCCCSIGAALPLHRFTCAARPGRLGREDRTCDEKKRGSRWSNEAAAGQTGETISENLLLQHICSSTFVQGGAGARGRGDVAASADQPMQPKTNWTWRQQAKLESWACRIEIMMMMMG